MLPENGREADVGPETPPKQCRDSLEFATLRQRRQPFRRANDEREPLRAGFLRLGHPTGWLLRTEDLSVADIEHIAEGIESMGKTEKRESQQIGPQPMGQEPDVRGGVWGFEVDGAGHACRDFDI